LDTAWTLAPEGRAPAQTVDRRAEAVPTVMRCLLDRGLMGPLLWEPSPDENGVNDGGSCEIARAKPGSHREANGWDLARV